MACSTTCCISIDPDLIVTPAQNMNSLNQTLTVFLSISFYLLSCLSRPFPYQNTFNHYLWSNVSKLTINTGLSKGGVNKHSVASCTFSHGSAGYRKLQSGEKFCRKEKYLCGKEITRLGFQGHENFFSQMMSFPVNHTYFPGSRVCWWITTIK